MVMEVILRRQKIFLFFRKCVHELFIISIVYYEGRVASEDSFQDYFKSKQDYTVSCRDISIKLIEKFYASTLNLNDITETHSLCCLIKYFVLVPKLLFE